MQEFLRLHLVGKNHKSAKEAEMINKTALNGSGVILIIGYVVTASGSLFLVILGLLLAWEIFVAPFLFWLVFTTGVLAPLTVPVITATAVYHIHQQVANGEKPITRLTIFFVSFVLMSLASALYVLSIFTSS